MRAKWVLKILLLVEIYDLSFYYLYSAVGQLRMGTSAPHGATMRGVPRSGHYKLGHFWPIPEARYLALKADFKAYAKPLLYSEANLFFQHRLLQAEVHDAIKPAKKNG